jgi:tRNA dimethylallyltransferase
VGGGGPLGAAPPNPTLRKKLSDKSPAYLFALLKKKDPARAQMMDTPSESNNKVRLIRAIEIALSQKNSHIRKATPYEWHELEPLWIGINPPRKVLEQKIATRLSHRLKHGMIAEGKRLHAAGLSYKRMEELGLEYRSLARYLQGKISRPDLETELNRDIRRYATHQLRYWTRNKEITWFTPSQRKAMETLIRTWLHN